MICVQLALDGTKDPCRPDRRHHKERLSAAERPGALPAALGGAPFHCSPRSLAGDRRWLVGLLHQREAPVKSQSVADGPSMSRKPLIEGRSSSSELGATAAALLLRRHGRTAAQLICSGARSAVDHAAARRLPFWRRRVAQEGVAVVEREKVKPAGRPPSPPQLSARA